MRLSFRWPWKRDPPDITGQANIILASPMLESEAELHGIGRNAANKRVWLMVSIILALVLFIMPHTERTVLLILCGIYLCLMYAVWDHPSLGMTLRRRIIASVVGLVAVVVFGIYAWPRHYVQYIQLLPPSQRQTIPPEVLQP